MVIMGFGKDGKGVMISEKRAQALGTLATDTALLIGTKLAITEDFRMLKAEMLAIVTGLTGGEGIGLYLGLAHGDMTTTQIESAIENNGPVNPGDLDVVDAVEKPVWIVGSYEQSDIGETEGNFQDVRTHGAMILSKHRWTFQSLQSWNWFIYNLGAQLTTGATVKIQVRDFGVWVI